MVFPIGGISQILAFFAYLNFCYAGVLEYIEQGE
jgi:hypothetical protein